MERSNRVRVPVGVHQVVCPCGAIFEYPQCESGFCEFETYVGLKTRSWYRLDLAGIQYLGKTRDDMLRAARAEEGRLLSSPEEMTCEQCGRSVFDCRKLGFYERMEFLTTIGP